MLREEIKALFGTGKKKTENKLNVQYQNNRKIDIVLLTEAYCNCEK